MWLELLLGLLPIIVEWLEKKLNDGQSEATIKADLKEGFLCLPCLRDLGVEAAHVLEKNGYSWRRNRSRFFSAVMRRVRSLKDSEVDRLIAEARAKSQNQYYVLAVDDDLYDDLSVTWELKA